MTADTPRERLYEAFADIDRDVEDKINRALDIGTEYLDMSLGFFTRIEDGVQTIVHATGDHELIQPGETCPLQEAYCRWTIDAEGPLAVQDVSASSIDRRAIERFDLGAYIGVKVTVDNELYGTVCFADHDQRDSPFTESEQLFLELLGEQIGGALEQRAYERRLREQTDRLKQEKQRFEGIAENSFDILFRIGLDARFTYVSSAVVRILGYQPETLTDEYFGEFMTDSAGEKAAGAFAQLLDGQQVENLEIGFLDRSGDVVVVEVNATPIVEGDEIVGVQGVGRDVTARKEQERELYMKTRAMDEAAVGISISDPHRPDESLVYVNDGFERITGYDSEDAIGRNCRFLQGEQTDPEAIERLRDAIDTHESATVELINYRQNGIPFWNRVQLNPVFDEQGSLKHYLGFQNDITERKRTEQLVRLLNRVLRHNLRNDMTVLLGWSRLLQDDDTHDPRQLGSRIERTSKHLVDLSEHARELERYARRDRNPQRLEPNALLEDLVDTHRNRFPDATVEMAVRTSRRICAGPELRKALSELVENAVKHNPAPAPQVTISVTDEDEWIRLDVEDDGPGIDDMEAKVIATGEETALVHGSGLGLWLTNWIVTRYGGSFRIESRTSDSSGTVATVRLPAIDVDTPIEQAERGPTVLFF